MRLTKYAAMIGGIAIVLWTFFAFAPSLKNSLLDYDDSLYITENPLVRNLSWDGISQLLASDKYGGSIFPIPMLSYAVEYHFFKLNPLAYHCDNLILHIFNALLVYVLIGMLSGRLNIAFLTALLFAVSPLRVESVAWIAERKDLLLSLFYLGSMIAYAAAIGAKDWDRRRYLFCSWGLFAFSLLCKPQAITLPLAILSLDYFYGRLKQRTAWLEKIPFIAIAAIFYINSVHPHVHLLSKSNPGAGSFVERILFAWDALLIYGVKNFIPYHLTTLYSFPRKTDGFFPAMVYVSPLIALAGGFILYRMFKGSRLILFGFAFFLVNIVMPLDLIWYNWFVVEHYMYLPSIGLFLSFAVICAGALERSQTRAIWARRICILGIYAVILTGITVQYCRVWSDDITLWSYVIQEDPRALRTAFAYWNRGLAYEGQGRYAPAIDDYGKAIGIYPQYAAAYNNRALAHYYSKEYTQSLNDAEKAKALGFDVNTKFLERLKELNARGNM